MNIHVLKDGGLPPETDLEHQKFRFLGQAMPTDEKAYKRLITACTKAQRQLKAVRQQVRIAKYESLGTIYEILCAAFANPKLMEGIKARAKRYGIDRSPTTSSALLFVRIFNHNKLEPATASQQAMALRGAALLGIAPGELATELRKRGGIAKLATYFKEQSLKTKSKPAEAPQRPQSRGKPPSGLSLRWPKNLLASWESVSRPMPMVAPSSRRGPRMAPGMSASGVVRGSLNGW